MRILPFSRSGRIRTGAALVAVTVSVVACDVVDLAKGSAPIFEQMWSVPAQGTSISIGSILPPGVQIYSTPASTPPDSSAFLLDVSSFGITRILGADCGPCSTLNGTTAPKPAFVLSAGSTQPLPQDVVSGAILGGTLTVSVTNNLTFDPIYVVSGGTPAQQGYMLLVVRSGSLVLGRDSVHGAAAIAPDGISRPFAAGTSMTRTINVQTGNATTNLTLDITVNSPAGDSVFIDVNRTVNLTASLRDPSNQPTLRAANVTMNVVNRTMTSVSGDSIELDQIDGSISKHVVGGRLEMTITNPFDIAGTVNASFGYAPSQAVSKPFDITSGVGLVRTVSLDSADMAQLMGRKVGLSIGGGVSSSSPITGTPKEIASITNRLALVLHVGGN
jgi:hypothetical protein